MNNVMPIKLKTGEMNKFFEKYNLPKLTQKKQKI